MTKTNLSNAGSTATRQESKYRVHPIALDALLQTGFMADAAGSMNDLRPCVPVSINNVRISSSLGSCDTGTIYAKAQRVGFDAVMFDAQLCDEHDHNLIELQGVRIKSHPGLKGLHSPKVRHPYLRLFWKPDISNLLSNNNEHSDSDVNNSNNDEFAQALNQIHIRSLIEPSNQDIDALGAALDLLAHKRPTARILELAREPGIATDRFLKILRAETSSKRFQTYTLGLIDDRDQLLGRQIRDAPEQRTGHVEHHPLGSSTEFDIFVLPKVCTPPLNLQLVLMCV